MNVGNLVGQDMGRQLPKEEEERREEERGEEEGHKGRRDTHGEGGRRRQSQIKVGK